MRGLDIGRAVGEGIRGGVGVYQDRQKQQHDDAQLAARQKFEQMQMELRLMMEQAGILREDTRYQQGRKDAAAAVTASTLSPWQEVDPETAASLEGTPQEGRISRRQTLPSRTIPEMGGAQSSDPGGDPFNVWTPTAAEQRTRKTEQDRDAFIGTLPGRAGTAAKARSYGLPVDPNDLKTPADIKTEQEAADLHHLGVLDRELGLRDKHERPPAESAGSKDDPKLPRGVENYLYDLRSRGVSRGDAEAEIARAWPKLLSEHSKLSPIKVQAALDSFWPVDQFGDERRPAKPAANGNAGRGRAAGAGPRDGLHDVGIVQAGGASPRTATAADVANVAKKLGISEAEARKQLTARGVVFAK